MNNDIGLSTTSPNDYWKFVAMSRFNYCIEAWYEYDKEKVNNPGSVNLSVVRASMIAVFNANRNLFKRKWTPELFKNVEKIIIDRRSREDDLREAFNNIQELLDDIRLIRFDTKLVYDATKVEEENESFDS